jgi:hypothetical protein
MLPAGSTDCHQQCYLLTTGGTGVPTNSTGLPIDARDAEIARLKFILGSKDTHIASLRSTIAATIEAADKEIADKDKYIIEVQDIIISGQRKEIGTKDAEIARLRAALQEIADGTNKDTVCFAARKALTEETIE